MIVIDRSDGQQHSRPGEEGEGANLIFGNPILVPPAAAAAARSFLKVLEISYFGCQNNSIHDPCARACVILCDVAQDKVAYFLRESWTDLRARSLYGRKAVSGGIDGNESLHCRMIDGRELQGVWLRTAQGLLLRGDKLVSVRWNNEVLLLLLLLLSLFLYLSHSPQLFPPLSLSRSFSIHFSLSSSHSLSSLSTLDQPATLGHSRL